MRCCKDDISHSSEIMALVQHIFSDRLDALCLFLNPHDPNSVSILPGGMQADCWCILVFFFFFFFFLYTSAGARR